MGWGANVIKGCYMCVWKCQKETQHFAQLVWTKKKDASARKLTLKMKRKKKYISKRGNSHTGNGDISCRYVQNMQDMSKSYVFKWTPWYGNSTYFCIDIHMIICYYLNKKWYDLLIFIFLSETKAF
jgi:hypothetical protein